MSGIVNKSAGLFGRSLERHSGLFVFCSYVFMAAYLFYSLPKNVHAEDLAAMAVSGTGGATMDPGVSGGGWQGAEVAMETMYNEESSGGSDVVPADPFAAETGGAEALVADLSHPDYTVSSQARTDLIAMGSGAVDPLIAVFKDPSADSNAVYAAQYILTDIGQPAVEPLFSLACGQSDISAQTYAEDTLMNIGTPAADYLLGVLGNENGVPAQRTEAAYLLGEMKDVRAYEPLMNIVNDRNEDPELWRMAVLKVGKLDDPRAIEPLFNLAQESQHGNRYELNAAELSLTGMSSQADNYFLNVLKEGDEGARAEAAFLMGERKDAEAVGPLIQTAQDKAENVSVRNTAIQALDKIGDSRAVEPLIGIAEDTAEDVSVRLNAAQTLGSLGDSRAVEPLISLLDPSTPENLQNAVMQALGNFKDSEAVAALAEIAENADDYSTRERTGALNALASIGEPAVETLIGFLDDEDNALKVGAAYKIALIKDERAVEALVGTAQDENEEVRLAGIYALGKTAKAGDERVISVLSDAFDDPSLNIRSQAVSAAGVIGETSLLNEVLALSVEDDTSEVRIKAEMNAVAIAGREAVVDALTVLRDVSSESEQKGLYQQAAEHAREKIGICAELKEKYGLTIQDNKYGAYTYEQLKIIRSIMESTPADVVSRIDSLKYDYDGELTIAQKALAYPEEIIIKSISADTDFIATLFHEIGHFMTESESEEMKTLHDASDDLSAFSSGYAQTNAGEDFSETACGYHMDSRMEFSRAVERAENGSKAYLDKLLYVASAYAAYQPDHMNLYRVYDNNAIESGSVPVVMEGGKITSIDGVNVYNSDGTYNLSGLKEYFSESIDDISTQTTADGYASLAAKNGDTVQWLETTEPPVITSFAEGYGLAVAGNLGVSLSRTGDIQKITFPYSGIKCDVECYGNVNLAARVTQDGDGIEIYDQAYPENSVLIYDGIVSHKINGVYQDAAFDRSALVIFTDAGKMFGSYLYKGKMVTVQ